MASDERPAGTLRVYFEDNTSLSCGLCPMRPMHSLVYCSALFWFCKALQDVNMRFVPRFRTLPLKPESTVQDRYGAFLGNFALAVSGSRLLVLMSCLYA